MEEFYRSDDAVCYGKLLNFDGSDVQVVDVTIITTDGSRFSHWEMWTTDHDQMQLFVDSFISKGWTFEVPDPLPESVEVSFDRFINRDGVELEDHYCIIMLPPTECRAESDLVQTIGRSLH